MNQMIGTIISNPKSSPFIKVLILPCQILFGVGGEFLLSNGVSFLCLWLLSVRQQGRNKKLKNFKNLDSPKVRY